MPLQIDFFTVLAGLGDASTTLGCGSLERCRFVSGVIGADGKEGIEAEGPIRAMIVEQALLMLSLAAVRHAARGAQKVGPRRQTKKLRGGSKVGVGPRLLA